MLIVQYRDSFYRDSFYRDFFSSIVSEGQDPELEFPDGEIDCFTFSSKYGPIEVEWAQIGGWSGIQCVTIEGDAVIHIVTAVLGGKGCIPEAMCSYAYSILDKVAFEGHH